MNKNIDNFPLSPMALRIFDDLYTFSDETIKDAYIRVSKEFGDEKTAKEAYKLLAENYWRPGTPIWFASGSTNSKIMSSCWVVDLEDSMDSIYDVVNVSRKIFQSGAGVGIPIGKLREKNGNIFEGKTHEETPTGKSSGPISFMTLFDAVGATTKSGGRARRAAIMCDMPVNHPDIMDFIECKKVDGTLSNMNISVAITNIFMQAVKDNIPFSLVSPSNGVVREVNARTIWDKIVEMAWETADPGILFIDVINNFNPLKKIHKIETTNPCLTVDTIVSTEKGNISIGDIVNDPSISKILSYDAIHNKIMWDEIDWAGMTKLNAEIIELEIEEEGTIFRLKCTPDHEVYTRNRGFVEAKDLTENDDILIKRAV